MPKTLAPADPASLKIPAELQPMLPETGWVRLGVLARSVGIVPDYIMNHILRNGVDYQAGEPGQPWSNSVRIEALDELIGPEKARQARYGVAKAPETVDVHASAYSPMPGIAVGEVAALASRRGVPGEYGRPVRLNRAALTWLIRILDAEKALPIDDDDFYDRAAVGDLVRAAASCVVFSEVDANPHLYADDPASAELVHDREFVDFLKFVGARWRKATVARWRTGRPEACGFDLYRLYGVAAPGADVAEYREMMRAAYESVVPAALRS